MADVVWIVRHGQRQDSVDPDWHERADRVHDPGLTDLGHRQARRTARRLGGEGIEAAYASPFLRTVQTADAIGRELGLAVHLEAGLGEFRNPEWFDGEPETLPVDELADRFDPIVADHDPLAVPGYPERRGEASERVGETVRQIAATEPGPVLLVGHGATVQGATQDLVGAPPEFEAPPCSVTRFDRRGGEWHVGVAGSISHVEGT